MADATLLILTILLLIFTNVFGGVTVQSDRNLYDGSPCVLADGRNGTCSEKCDDPIVVQNRENRCGYRRNKVIGCCPHKSRRMKYPTIETVCNGWIDITDDDRPHGCIPSLYPAKPNEHQHMVVLGWNLTDGSIEWECGGSLIHPLYVLTAAHCLINKGSPPDMVRIGGVDLLNDTGHKDVFNFRVLKTFSHPNFTSSQNYHDIALIQIDGRVKCRFAPERACLYTKRKIPRKELLVMGYGAPAFGRTNNYKLYQGNLSVIESDECKVHYPSDEMSPNGLIESQICAQDLKGEIDTCQGDSGGPMLFNVYKKRKGTEYIEKKAYIVGITSFGAICLSGLPGVYTRVYSYLDWIESIISQPVVETGQGHTIFAAPGAYSF